MDVLQKLFTSAEGEMNALLILSIILIGGTAGAWLAKRFHAPGITGNILAGVLIGPACLNIFRDTDVVLQLQPLSTFAMALVAVVAGGNLSYRRLHNALRRIISIALFEVTGAVLLVFIVCYWVDGRWQVATLLACLAAGGAPATIIAVVRESRARGPLVKTLLSVVSLDSSVCIILFAFATRLIADYSASEASKINFASAAVDTAWQFFGALVIGIGLAFLAERLVHLPRTHSFSTVLVAIMLCAGVSDYLGFSPLLTALFFGVYLGNSSEVAERQLSALEPIEFLLYVCFFTLAGISLHIKGLSHVGILCVFYLIARFVGKSVGAVAGGWLSNSSKRIWMNIPGGLVPQAGVAIGLIILLKGDARIDSDISALVGTLVLAAVTVTEIIGPFMTRAALKRGKETDLDRARLMDFIQEEYILTNLHATDKWDALQKMTDFFLRVHHMKPAQRATLYSTIVEREKSMSTAIGKGAAIPHGRIETGRGIKGVMGICREGLDYGAPDGKPVNIIVLIVTPKDHEEAHLKVLASLAGMISHDVIRKRLIAAIDANDAWEVIESEESRSFNYFLEDEAEEA